MNTDELKRQIELFDAQETNGRRLSRLEAAARPAR